MYQQFLEYRLSVSVKFRTDKISVVGNGFGQISVIGYQLNLNKYVIPDDNQFTAARAVSQYTTSKN